VPTLGSLGGDSEDCPEFLNQVAAAVSSQVKIRGGTSRPNAMAPIISAIGGENRHPCDIVQTAPMTGGDIRWATELRRT
jgi:hypothetical protein